MPFVAKEFNTPIYGEKTEDPKKVIIISCEGKVTEPGYFNTIKSKLSEHISSLIEIEIVQKKGNESDPKSVLNNLEVHCQSKYDYKNDHDVLWIVCDREKVDIRKRHLEKIIPECHSKGYKLALTNPLFEFWVLMHVVDISKYTHEELFCNKKISNSRKFIDKEISNLMEGNGGYNKKSFNPNIVSLENIKKAIDQEKSFTNTVPEILDNLGSNISQIVLDILDESALSSTDSQ